MKECDTNTIVVFPSFASLLDYRDNCHVFDSLSKLPYVWIISNETDGVSDEGFRLVPAEVTGCIHNPEPFSTWIRGNDSQWLKMDVGSPEKIFAEVFRLAFFDRIDRLVRVLQEMGVCSIEVTAADKIDAGKIFKTEAGAKAKVEGFFSKVVAPKIEASIEAKWERDVKQELEKKLNVRFPKKNPNGKRVQELIRLYGFNGDMLVEIVNQGIKSIESFVSVNFMENTYVMFKQTLLLALKLRGKPIADIGVTEKLEVSYTSYRKLCQKFNIRVTQ